MDSEHRKAMPLEIIVTQSHSINMNQMKALKPLKARIKDKHAPLLREWARSVNFVWNYVNELSSRSIRERGRFLSAFDMHPYTKGAGKYLGLHSQTIQGIAEEYVISRKQFKKRQLK
jgi:putative transposase